MIWTSSRPPIEVDATTVGDAVAAAVAAHRHRIALVDGASGAAMSYAELGRRIDRVGSWLDGERLAGCLALWAPNGPPAAVWTLAAMRAGVTVTPLNPAWTDAEVRRQLADAGASLVVATAHLRARADAFGLRCLSLDERPAGPPRSRRRDVECDSVTLLPYSSGTTGLPKGVMLTHRQVVAVCRQIAEAMSIDDHDVTLAAAPWFHILGMTAELLVPLSCGATVVTMPRFDPATFLGLLARHHVTYVAVPPPVAALLASHPEVADADLRHLELIAVGGAPLPVATQEALGRRLPSCAIGQGWGLTETAGAICIPGRTDGTAPGTVGPLVGSTELRVVDPESGTVLGPGISGELQARGPQTMLGYLHHPGATAEMVDTDGWVRTGDLGHVDRAGSVVVIDRIKELIKVNAYQVAPAEVEAALVQHPAVVDAAVVGRPDERTGETPVAYVVVGAGIATEELTAWAAGRLAPYKRPTAIRIVDRLPRTASGKLLRRELREEALASA